MAFLPPSAHNECKSYNKSYYEPLRQRNTHKDEGSAGNDEDNGEINNVIMIGLLYRVR